MANKITYTDKIQVNPKKTHVNQFWADDANEIKNKFNLNDDILDALSVAGAKTYQTYADLLAVSPVPDNGTPAKVANDPTASNNGYYSVVSGTWIKDALFLYNGYEVITNVAELDALISSSITDNWIIIDDVVLNGNKTIPANKTLHFNGGVVSGAYNLIGSNTKINAGNVKIFNSDVVLTGTWNTSPFNVAWYGALADGVTDDSPAIELSINAPFLNVSFDSGKEYSIESTISLDINKDVNIDLNGSTLKRPSTYTTGENVILIDTGTSNFSIKNGYIVDESGEVNFSFIYHFTAGSFSMDNINITSEGIPFSVYNSEDIKITNCIYENPIPLPLITSTFGRVLSSSNVLIENNIIKNAHVGCTVSAIGNEDCGNVKVINNAFLLTQDTGLFCRITGAGGNDYRGCLIKGNTFEDIGKTAIKYTCPSSHVGAADLEAGIITNNTIKGYALKVISDAIACFRDATDTSVFIKNIIISNNVVDGFDTTGNPTTIISPAGARGIRLSYVDNATVTGNIISNCISDGLIFSNCTNFIAKNNIIDNCCLDSAGTAGIYLDSSNYGLIDCISRNAQNTSSGIYIYKTRECQVFGSYSDNTNYGIEENGGGVGGTKSGLNTYTALLKGNTVGAIIQNGESSNDSSIQRGCSDDDGDRHQGTSARRDIVTASWTSYRNAGYIYWNTNNNDLEVFKATAFVKTDGTAVDS